MFHADFIIGLFRYLPVTESSVTLPPKSKAKPHDYPSLEVRHSQRVASRTTASAGLRAVFQLL